jgi:ABC-type protease/lipase transport system fused ATPase/permease subunit
MDESADGFDTVIAENGWRLSEGIRRRIALARGLTTDGKLVILDEPTESLDAEGAAAVHAILGNLAQQGRTIIIMSHDAKIVKGHHMVLDLNTKPIPELVTVAAQPTQPQEAPEGQPAQSQPAQPQPAQSQPAQSRPAEPQPGQPQQPRMRRPAE